jgi:hypothetical protein
VNVSCFTIPLQQDDAGYHFADTHATVKEHFESLILMKDFELTRASHSVCSDRDIGYARVSVQDTGAGMSQVSGNIFFLSSLLAFY